jgi:hypothetical protein
MFENAATGSPKNIVPARLMAMSSDCAAKVQIFASACSNATLRTFSAPAMACATPIIRSERATPKTNPRQQGVRRRGLSRRFRPVVAVLAVPVL